MNLHREPPAAAEAEPRMDLLMKAVKAVRSMTAGEAPGEQLEKQRHNTELLSRIATPPVGVAVEAFSVGEIPCERTTPSYPHRKDFLILYCHGGGYTGGGLNYARILAEKFALSTGLEVISFAYRLAPEHPWPAAHEDAQAVWDYLMLKGYSSRQILLAGDSAGGNLALELCLRLSREDRFLPGAMILMSPWTDMTCSSPTYESCKELDPLLTEEYIRFVRSAYAGEDADFAAPELSPLFADTDCFEGFPATLIQVGYNEILRNDSEALAQKLKDAHCRVRLEVYRGGWHVFQQLPLRRAARAMQEVRTFVDHVLCQDWRYGK